MYDMHDEEIDELKKKIKEKERQQDISIRNISNYNDVAKFYYNRYCELSEENTRLKEEITELNKKLQLYNKQ